MDRSQEKVLTSQTKLHALDQSANIHQKVHENQAGIIGVNRTAQRKNAGESSIENLPYVEGRNGSDGLNSRKQEPLISPLQAQYFHTVSNSGVVPPYLSTQAMDHRALGNFLYRYNPAQMAMFPPGYAANYAQRIPNGEEAREPSTSMQPSERTSDAGVESKEPVRTESVIKIVTERTDTRKPETVDKRQAQQSSDDYSRPYMDRNGDLEPSKHVTSYRGPRDKQEVTSNGDAQHRSGAERTLSDFRPYQTPPVNSKTPGAYAKDYGVQKPDYIRPPVSSQSSMFAGMPKLTPIAPRGHPSVPFSSSPAATDGNIRLSTAGPSVRPAAMIYHSPRDYPLTTEGLISHRGDNRPEELSDSHRVNYLQRNPAYENFPAYWDRGDYASRYPGHSAYQGYGYARTMHLKPPRPDDKENVKEPEDTRNRTSDSIKESSISPDRSHFPKEPSKALESNAIQSRDQVSSQTYNPAVTSQSDQSTKNQVTLSKNEKPVLPENVRYKVNDDKKNALKSDKVTVYPKQGQAYVVSVRETPRSYFANGRYVDNPDERTQNAGVFEPAGSKKDDSQRSVRVVKDKPTAESRDKFVDGGPSNEYSRRRIDANTHERILDDSKKPNDRNNNSSFSSYPRYQNPNERPRPSNRISLGQDKVFVPPNVTLEMFEKREQEMERAAASCRTTDSTRSSDAGLSSRAKVPAKKDGDSDSRYHSPDQSNPRPSTNKQETPNCKCDTSSKGSDDEELKIIDERVSAPAQTRNGRPEEKRTLSPSRLSRITSSNAPNTSTANNPSYFTPFGANFSARRTPSESEMVARENAERSLQAAYLYGGNIPFQPNAQFMGHGGRGEMPVMMPVDMLYGGMYKSHMMDPAQGGTVMQDPLTGSLVVVPEALLNPNMFNPLATEQLMLDPQLARFWGMHQASMEDPRWQQFHQQQTKHFYEQMEKYKHDMLMAQQQGWWQGYPLYQKQFEAQKKVPKDEESSSRTDQRPKSRDDPSVSKQRTEKPEEPPNKEKQSAQVNERPTPTAHDPRKEDLDSKPDNPNQRPHSKPESSEAQSTVPNEKADSVATKELVKPAISEYPEERLKVKERMQQDEKTRQFQQYMLREPVFDQPKFPFPRMQASLSKPLYSPTDVPRDARDVPHNPSHLVEVTRSEVSPQVVSAAATLANMDLGTRFPFNQQGYKPSEERSLHGPEQIERRSVANENVKVENATSPRSSERSLMDNKVDISTVPALRRAPNEIPITSQVKKEATPRHPQDGFDVLSLIRQSPKPSAISTSQSNRRNSFEESYRNSNVESSRLLVAKAEKLSQDEELEVIRIDTPYVKIEGLKQERQIPNDKAHDMNLLMSLSKDINGTAESPSSKSEIFWIEGSDIEEDFEVQAISDSVRPLKVEFDGNNKENSITLSLQSIKSEEEKKTIHEKIEKLRVVAKRRTREERFTALTRQKELKSPSSIVNSVTASLNEVLAMNVMEKDIRLKLAELQKKYREKHRELARLQPKCKHGNDDNSGGKSTPIKRGPGRPRKRKYFGASLKSGKTSPTLLTGDSISDNPGDSVESTFKSGGSSPSSCPQSPGLKSVTSEDLPVFKDSVEPVKKKKKKSVSKKKEIQPSPSPETVSPTIVEPKPRVKSSKKLSSSSSKPKSSSNGLPMTTSTSSLNMARLMSAISPLMLEDNSAIESEITESIPSAVPIIKPKPKRAKKIKKEKLSEETVEAEQTLSSSLTSPTLESLTLANKNSKAKSPKKSKRKSKTPSTPKGKTEFVFPETVNMTEQKTSSIKKEPGKHNDVKEKKAERDEDSSENDEVFTMCLSGGALDMLADFASSASFEKEKQPGRESPFERASLKGMKRGRPKKPNSPGPELDPTNPPKKKRKKKKPPTPGTKSPKKINSTPEEKEIEVSSQPETVTQPPSVPPPPPPPLPLPPPPAPVETVEPKEQPKPEPVEEQIEKVVKEELEEPCTEEEEMAMPYKEPELDVTPPPEPIKEKRRKSRTSLPKEVDESKQAFALFGDWQPRRSERIFINSSVAPQSSADLSPLSSPTSKTNEFGWTKKVKKVSKGKKPTKSEEVSDAEAVEEESPLATMKPLVKTKKKKSPGKGKKRRSSSVTDPDFVVRTPKRKAAKRDRSYEEADEDDDEDMGEEGDEIQEDDIDDKESYQEDTEDPNDETLDRETTTKQEDQLTEQDSHDIETKAIADNAVDSTKDTEAIPQSPVNEEEEDHITKTTLESSADTETESKVEESVVKKHEVSEDLSESHDIDEKEKYKEEAAATDAEPKDDQKTDTILPKNEPTSKATVAESTSLEETTIEREDDDLPPEPVISFFKDELKNNTKMLLPVDRVFYRGRITFYQEPDLYGIVLPGERGRRPHLRSTEQLLSHAVKDIVPPAVQYLPVGTRVCAHWSPQYRCFYPGNVIETPPDEKSEVGKLWVEFDDGDSGIFPLSDLRKIKTDCPVQADDVESDVVLPERRTHVSSSRGTSPSNRRAKEQETSHKNKDDDTSGWDSTDDAPIRRTRGRGKRRAKQRDRTLSEEATDSDAPRGSQDSEDDDNTDHAQQSRSQNKLESNTKDDNDTNLRSPRQKRGKRRGRLSMEEQEPEETTETTDAGEDTKRYHKDDKGRESKAKKKNHEDDTDDEEPPQEPGTIRPRARSSRLTDLDLRKKSLTLNLNSSPRSGIAGSESPAQDSTSQDEDSGSCSDVFDDSPQTENKIFQPRLGKRRRSTLDKLKQEKSAGELWSWSGKNHQNKRKGKGRKVFYKTIVRGDETISVGDCAVFTSNPSKSNNLPYVGKIESMWEGCSGNMVVRVKWYYHPEETKAGRKASDAKHSLYRSTHIDENDVQTISHKCEVVSPEEYRKRTQDTIGTRSTTTDRSDRLFSCVGTYDPSTEKIDQKLD